MLMLALHRQYCVEGSYKIRSFNMEIRTSHDEVSDSDSGYIELHYMELHESHLGVVDDDTAFELHRPYLWSIDVGYKDDPEDSQSTAVPARIIYYAVSGDGNYVATLSTKDKLLQLDMWDLEMVSPHMVDIADNEAEMINQDAHNERRAPFRPKPCSQCRIPISQPVDSDIFHTCWDEILRNPSTPLRAAVSYDASKVILMDGNKSFVTEAFQVFTFTETASSNEKSALTRQRQLTRIPDGEIGVQFQDFKGFGKFHFISAQDRDTKDELFITCDGANIDIYCVGEKWDMLRRIALSTGDPVIEKPWRTIEGIGGKYFSWADMNGVLSVCDLEAGKLVRPVALDGTASFSVDGALILCSQTPSITTTRWAESGTMLASTNVDESMLSQVFSAFIENNNQVIVPAVKVEDIYGRGRLGMILDTTTLLNCQRVSFTTRLYEQQLQSAGSRGQYLYTVHGSKLDLIKFQDIVVLPYPQPRQQCDERCLNGSVRVHEPETIQQSSYEKATVPVLGSNLTININFRELAAMEYAIVVSVSNGLGESRVALEIPPLMNVDSTGYKLYVDKANMQLVINATLIFMVWKLPTTFEGDATLVSGWWKQPFSGGDEDSGEANPTPTNAILKVCPHGEAYTGFVDENNLFNTISLCRADPFERDTLRFYFGLYVIISKFDAGNDTFKQAVLRYVGRYVNRTAECNGQLETALTMICKFVSQDSVAMYSTFLKAMFTSTHVRWVPRPGLSRDMNPILLLLDVAQTVPRAISLAKTVIDYCIRMAKAEQDAQFVSPVLDSLQDLLNLKELPPDLVPSILRELAFIPVKERSYIIDHAIIAHPPEFLSLFRKRKIRPIYVYEDPVLQLDHSLQFREHDPLNENFSRDLFVASFDMLWRTPAMEPDTRPPIDRIRDKGRSPPTWVHILLSIILTKCKIWPKAHVEFYDIPLESLDNPAIAALIEYKWNTIGYMYWLVRFLCQCLYYVLVLVAVFVQVYDSDDRLRLKGLFVAIIATSSIFLLLEVRQSLHNPSRYFTSPYNLVDFVAFALPLAGSVCQIVNIERDDSEGNISTLSFSVLFIFLHFGGIWDPVNDEFEGDNWAFHILMILYFTFTTIVLLNVLIALMNVAYNDADETWRIIWKESRLRYIESAEEITYNVPGLRESYDLFPKNVYFFANQKEQKVYRAKYSDDDIGDFLGGGCGGGNSDMTLKQAEDQCSSSVKSGSVFSGSSSGVVKQCHEELKRLQEKQHVKQQKSIDALKQELQQSQLQLQALQDEFRVQRREMEAQSQAQLRELQRGFEKQMVDMKEVLIAALAARS
ncbi:hypothetical protein BGZ65_000428 [Modicella reniformis]|uniref:Ion transport domain-containing protein n=1 Tax=Modicella reniformis TaxID=1440133 RepID=A0A9P6J2Z7_9FUNG|nr:hypothetical protein BGZ65_000428 [Modicella reniformis]